MTNEQAIEFGEMYLEMNEDSKDTETYQFVEIALGTLSAQSDIKQAAKLLLDFIESCPGGDSYLITPNGDVLVTDWGYALEGMRVIHDWAESEEV